MKERIDKEATWNYFSTGKQVHVAPCTKVDRQQLVELKKEKQF